MVEKNKQKKTGEALGVSGFTLGIAGFIALIFSIAPAFIFFIGGVIFCAIQQKKNPTKLGKSGLIINIIGIILTIIFLIIIIKYLGPIINEMQQQALQNFPIA